MELKGNTLDKTIPLFRSTRIIHYIMMFMACMLQYSLRFSLNMSIVCMVVPPQQQLAINTTGFEEETYQGTTSSVEGTSNVKITDASPVSVTESSFGEESVNSRCRVDTSKDKVFGYEGEFLWSRSQVGYALASFFYGYIPMQVLAGWLGDKYGFRHVLGTGTLVGGVLSLLTPLAARWHYWALFTLRLIMGFSLGVTFPSIYSSMAKWVPKNERIIFTGVVFGGPSLGIMLSFVLSGFLCRYSWTLVFYILGAVTILWYLVYLYTVHNSPAEHPRISNAETEFINHANAMTADASEGKAIKVPWCKLLTSTCVWGLCICHFSTGWLLYTVNAGIPLFMQDVLFFNISSNGALSSMPSLIQLIFSVLVGLFLEFIHKKLITSLILIRRLSQTVFAIGAAICVVLIGYMNCENRYIAVVLFSLTFFFLCFVRGGSACSPSDVAPRMAGSVYGFMNFIGNFSGFLAPTAIGNLTPTGSQEEWQTIFFLTGGIVLAGFISYVVLVKADEQDWARGESVPIPMITLTVEAEEVNPDVMIIDPFLVNGKTEDEKTVREDIVMIDMVPNISTVPEKEALLDNQRNIN